MTITTPTLLATFNVYDVDGEVAESYEVHTHDGGAIVRHYVNGVYRRQATPTLSKDSAMSYALMQCGWGPLGGWAAHDERDAEGDKVIGLPNPEPRAALVRKGEHLDEGDDVGERWPEDGDRHGP